jgi:hypothetical protein
VTTVFLDRSIGSRLPEALEILGFDVAAHDHYFDPTTPDVEWLENVAERGWVVVTNDKQIRYNELERRTLIETNTGYFVLGGGSRTNRQMALTLMLAWDAIQEVAASTPRPFAFTVHASGRLTALPLLGPKTP